jgi:16S rRNA (cytosine967-C5)-methyltransferase
MVRKLAYEILVAVIIDRQYANLLLRKRINHLSLKDRALITQIVYGTLQHYRYIRFQYQGLLKSNCDKRNKILLDMSVYQLFWLDKVPAYAIINDAVEISKSIKGGQYHQMVNGILRNLERQGQLISDDYTIEQSFEPWLLTMVEKQYNHELMRMFALSSNSPSKVVLRVNTLKTSLEDVLSNKLFTKAQAAMGVCYQGNIMESEYYHQGLVTIQDGGSQLVAPFSQVQPGMQVLDLCAAPGSKTAHLAALMENTGQITAIELHPHRILLLESTLTRLGVTNTIVRCGNALEVSQWYPINSYDLVVADVPCSGLGVLKRKPEIKQFITPANLDELVELQAKLLVEGAKMVKVNGTLVYSTCTINKKENSGQINQFIKQYPQFTLVEEQLIWPDQEENDGFYLARLVKTAVM